MRINTSFTFCVTFICFLLLVSACQPVTNSSDSEKHTPGGSPEVAVQLTESPRATLTLIPPPSHTETPTQPATLPVPSPTPEATPLATLMPTNRPTRTPLGGWLVFQSRRHDTNGDGVIDLQDGIHLYTLNLATNELNQLTSGDHFDRHPAWSPDRTHIVFVSNRDGNDDLFTINADGTGLEKLTNTDQGKETPSWSPDGTQIAYTIVDRLDSGVERRSLHLLSIEDKQTRLLETSGLTNSFEPQWSPDGRYLLFTGQTELREGEEISYDYAIYLFEMSTNAMHRLTSSWPRIDQPKWLPRDDYFLSFLQSPGIFSSVSVNVFELRRNGESFLLHPVFVMEDATGQYVWGSNGEWFISVLENNLQGTSVEAYFSSLDLAVAPVDFASQQHPPSPPGSSYAYSFVEEGRLITENEFYDDHPEWAP
ncbi:MAG: PD40 domain-containing protein [Ardenticatenales bacterium]|nr:PD40 domain-containing protein [Ardenticatenales bacterium]